jgi:hypothetical protein
MPNTSANVTWSRRSVAANSYDVVQNIASVNIRTPEAAGTAASERSASPAAANRNRPSGSSAKMPRPASSRRIRPSGPASTPTAAARSATGRAPPASWSATPSAATTRSAAEYVNAIASSNRYNADCRPVS